MSIFHPSFRNGPWENDPGRRIPATLVTCRGVELPASAPGWSERAVAVLLGEIEALPEVMPESRRV